jgi:hypothetical protein
MITLHFLSSRWRSAVRVIGTISGIARRVVVARHQHRGAVRIASTRFEPRTGGET